ncbi:MAG TPA: ClpXP protease specificity-enhancing factor SspB [Magnetospirillum sp.]|nr:ClpXP protease specificity-enhancing factor SspB [Magnetospirillum sp.]
MPEDSLRYDRMVEDALRGVLRDVLIQTAQQGLFGDHHFYITFRTRFAGVHVPGHVLARHPDEMTIVLQHQFWGLEVTPDRFEVTLSFSGVSERLVVPFAAVTGFADPSAKFGLQFQVEEDEEFEDEDLPDEVAPAALAAAAPDEDEAAPAEGAKVIALDAFRKK